MENTETKSKLEEPTDIKQTSPAQCSEISIKEFLDFLRTAYQVTDSVEETLSSVEGTTDVVNWIKLKNTELVKPKPISCQTSEGSVDKGTGTDENIKQKLDDVLNEGLLDSVLPYLVPSVPTKKSCVKLTEKTSACSVKTVSSKDSSGKKKSSESVKSLIKTESEVEIHVCDEVKNVKKNFVCKQKLLVEKMGYFAEVTAGQKLEDMDISVHCDVGIFEWLMRWVKKELLPEEEWPELDTQCVIPILVSATFLQMEPLLQDCLLFCHENINNILTTATNLSCVNESIISRLAAMYTNTELETIKDKRDKIQSRLYCKMITSLFEPDCESVRGHWHGLARIFRCLKCEQLVMPYIATILPCHPTCMSINRYGQLVSQHVPDTTWDINDYILGLYAKLKTWRKVYWHLWGDCHFLMCSVCLKPFPAYKMKWCCYHSESPQYFTIDSQKSPLPVGRYPCCGERAYKFQLLNTHSGCQFREHIPNVEKARDAAVVSILEQFRSIIDVEPPDLIFPERLTRLVAKDTTLTDSKLVCKEIFWWDGLQIIPPRRNFGLLGSFGPKVVVNVSPSRDSPGEETFDEESSSDSSSSASTHSEECSPSVTHCVRKRTVIRKKKGRQWQLNLSARSNQDVQRANEETILSKMVQFLTTKSSLEPTARQKGYLKHITPPGGIYVRLQAEWKEAIAGPGNLKRMYKNNPKIRASRLS